MHELKPCTKYRLVHAILVVEAESAAEATDALNEQFNGHLQDGDFVVADWAFTDVVEASAGFSFVSKDFGIPQISALIDKLNDSLEVE